MKKRNLLKVGIMLTLVSVMFFVPVRTTFAIVEYISLEELVSKSSTILLGTVSNLESHWNEDQTMIYTSVTVSVKSHLKWGAASKEVTIEVPGGTVGEITLWVSDTPTFEEDQEIILFLRKEYFQIIGWFQGKYTIVDDKVVERGISVEEFTGQIKTIMHGSTTSANLPSVPKKSLIEPLKGFGPLLPGFSVKEPNVDMKCGETVSVLAAEACPPTLSDFYGEFKWPGSCPTVEYEIYENTENCTGEGAAIQASAGTWNDVNGSCFTLSYVGDTTLSSPTKDGHNVIRWGSTGGSIATAYIWYQDTDIIEGDTVFDDSYTWSTDPNCPPDKMDVQNIATHEFGHWLMLVDLYQSCNSELTMYGYSDLGETKNRTLEQSDKDGICYIYQGNSATTTVAPDTTTTAPATTTTEITTTTTTATNCPSKKIYGEYSEETELLRYFRDNVLSKTTEGQEIIRLYYEWSPVIVEAMEEDEEFKEEVKEMIDGVLGLIRGEE